MVSAAKQTASNLNFSVASPKAEELKKRIWVYARCTPRLPAGYVHSDAGHQPDRIRRNLRAKLGKGILGLVNLFSGGAIKRMAIFALNIMPYISASIIMPLIEFNESFEALKKEGEQDAKQINQYTRYLTVALATFQAYGISVGLKGRLVVYEPGWFFRLSTVITLVGGTMFLMWLGEQITQRGVGNGTSLIIFVGIVAGLPSAMAGLFELVANGSAAARDPDPAFAGHAWRPWRPLSTWSVRSGAACNSVPEASGRQSHVPGRGVASAP